MPSAAIGADTLTAIGGIGAFLATVVLAVLAYKQMRATREQSAAALEQVRVSREAAARQVYPLVYAHHLGPTKWEEEEDAFAIRYYLSNEGLGPALNVEHGVQIGPDDHIFGHEGPYMFRSIQPGEFLPPLDPKKTTDPVPPQSLVKHVSRADYYGSGHASPIERPVEQVFICRYENLFGDKWETRNSTDPTKKPQVRRLEEDE